MSATFFCHHCLKVLRIFTENLTNFFNVTIRSRPLQTKISSSNQLIQSQTCVINIYYKYFVKDVLRFHAELWTMFTLFVLKENYTNGLQLLKS